MQYLEKKKGQQRNEVETEREVPTSKYEKIKNVAREFTKKEKRMTGKYMAREKEGRRIGNRKKEKSRKTF